MYEFIRGPLAWTCFTIMIAGTIFQVTRFFILSKKQPLPNLDPAWIPDRSDGPFFSKSAFRGRLLRLKLSVFGVNPATAVITTIFHVTIFVMPIFVLAHNVIMGQLWGISLCPVVLSQWLTDFLSVIVFACLLFFLSRRLFLRRVRAITTFYDYFILLLVATPFVTGFLAIHDLFDYKTLIIIHLLSVDIIMVTIPFTKFVHMLYFFLNRFFMRQEYSFGAGSRRW